MRDKLIELINEKQEGGWKFVGEGEEYTTDVFNFELADHLIENNVFVLPEKMKDSWGLALPFMMRLFVADEAEIEKIKREFELQEVNKILTDIRDYLVAWRDNNAIDYSAERWIDETALADLAEYAEKLGVEL